MEKIFELSKIEEIAGKFEARITEARANIAKLTQEYTKLEQDLDIAIEADIMEGSAKTTKDIQNISGRLQNIKSQLDIEQKTLEKVSELRANAVAGAVKDFKKEYVIQANAYHEAVEKPIYEQFKELREKQAELLVELLNNRNRYVNELHEFDEICGKCGMEGFRFNPTMMMFENSLYMPHRNFPELGMPLLNATQLLSFQDMYMRQMAEINARMNIEKKRFNK